MKLKTYEDFILSLLNYADETEKSEVNGRVLYNTYSPNNIRKLIITPFGLIVLYYIRTSNNNPKITFFGETKDDVSKSILVMGNYSQSIVQNLYREHFSEEQTGQKKIKSTIDIIFNSSKRYFSMLEEILILNPQNTNYSNTDKMILSNPAGLLGTMSNKYGKTFKDAYVRMRGVFYINIALNNLDKLVNIIRLDYDNALRNNKELMLGTFLKADNILPYTNDDYKTDINLTPTWYKTDGINGRLYKYFYAIKEAAELDNKEKRVQQNKDDTVSSFKEEMNELENSYNKLFYSRFKLGQAITHGEVLSISNSEDSIKNLARQLNKVEIYQEDLVKNKKMMKIVEKNGSTYQKCKDSVDNMKRAIKELYTSTMKCHSEIFVKISEKYPNLAKSIMLELAKKVGTNYASIMRKQIEENSGNNLSTLMDFHLEYLNNLSKDKVKSQDQQWAEIVPELCYNIGFMALHSKEGIEDKEYFRRSK